MRSHPEEGARIIETARLPRRGRPGHPPPPRADRRAGLSRRPARRTRSRSPRGSSTSPTALDAMTTKRLYREELSFEVALDEIHRGRGTDFCDAMRRRARARGRGRPARLARAGSARQWLVCPRTRERSAGRRPSRDPRPRAASSTSRSALRSAATLRRPSRRRGTSAGWTSASCSPPARSPSSSRRTRAGEPGLPHGPRLHRRGRAPAAAGARRTSSASLQHVPEWLRQRYPWFIQTFNIANVVLSGLAAWSVRAALGTRNWRTRRLDGDGGVVVAARRPRRVHRRQPRAARPDAPARARPRLDGERTLLARRTALRRRGRVGRYRHRLRASPLRRRSSSVVALPLVLIQRALAVPTLREQAFTDHKTGLLNSRGIDQPRAQ